MSKCEVLFFTEKGQSVENEKQFEVFIPLLYQKMSNLLLIKFVHKQKHRFYAITVCASYVRVPATVLAYTATKTKIL